MTNVEELRDWLNVECEKRNLSWREASLRAGVYAGAISAIMNGQRPGLEVSKALAQYFGASTEHVLRMAGHLPSLPENGVDPELQDTANRLIELWEILKKLDPASAERLRRIAVNQSEMVLAAARAGRLEPETQPEDNEEPS